MSESPQGSQASHGPVVPTPEPGTLPQADGSSLGGRQLIILMGVALLAACIFLDLVSR